MTLTLERATQLCQAAEEALPAPARRFYPFGSMEYLSLSNPAPILGSTIFLNPRDYRENRLHPLLPPFTPPPEGASMEQELVHAPLAAVHS